MRSVIGSVLAGLMLATVFGTVSMHHAAAQDKAKATKDKETKATAAVFEVYKDKGGEFRFRLKDADGTLLAISGKGYETKADCQKIIDTIKSQAAKAKVEDDTKK